MVAPITGPFSVTFIEKGPPNINGHRPDWVYGVRVSSRQKPPYIVELPFSYGCTRIKSAGGGDGVDYTDAYSQLSLHEPAFLRDRLYAKVYEKWAGKVQNDSAELGSTIATWKQSHDMILDRAMRLRLGFKAVRRGDVQTLKALWGKGAGIRNRLKHEGSNVLEYSFGWAPLAGDIANAVKKLGGEINPPRAVARNSVEYSYFHADTGGGSVLRTTNVSGKLECTIRARIKVTNPNAVLLNQLGLTNPATVLWEVIPWSFVVDYFVNVQVFLQSFTDLIGLELERASYTFFTIEDGSVSARWNITPKPSYNPLHYTWERCEVTRSPGVPGPSLVLRLPWRMSMKRAATSISLLLQRLR